MSIGVAAHISAASPGGARYDPRLTEEQRSNAHNGIWACQNHAKLIDNDPDRYTATKLRRLKHSAESAALSALTQSPSSRARTSTRTIPARPKIVFAESRGAVLRTLAGGQPLFYVAQLWFRNEPVRGAATAEGLAAYLNFFSNGVRLFPELRGEWAFTNAANNVGFDLTSAAETHDRLLPNGDYAKLIVLQKRTEDDYGYAWSKGAREYPGRRHPSHRIPPGEYQLQVRVRGLHIDDVFHFTVINLGAGRHPKIELFHT